MDEYNFWILQHKLENWRKECFGDDDGDITGTAQLAITVAGTRTGGQIMPYKRCAGCYVTGGSRRHFCSQQQGKHAKGGTDQCSPKF